MYAKETITTMANRIMLNETSYHGAGAIQEIATEAKAHGFQKAFVCSDPDLIKFGVTKKVTDVLDKNGLVYEIYSDIKPNPTIQNVQHGVQAVSYTHLTILLHQFHIVLFAFTDRITGCYNLIFLHIYHRIHFYQTRIIL